MSFVSKSIAIALTGSLAFATHAFAGAAGGGTELPSDASGKGSQNPKAGGAGDPKGNSSMQKGGSMEKDGSMEKGGSMKKGSDKM